MELHLDYKIKGLLKRFDIMYSITEFKRKVLMLSVKALSSYDNKWVNASSFMDRRLGLTILTFCWRDCFSLLKFDQWRRYCLVDSIALPQLQIGFTESRNYDEV